MNQREFKVFKIENGIVIDHIPHWKAIEVMELLGLRERKSLVTLGIGLNSQKMGQKDLLKVEGRELTEQETHRLALVAPDATVNVIRDSQRLEKYKVRLPDQLDRILRCGNAGCITRHEIVPTRFYTESRSPVRVRCHYCCYLNTEEDLELL